MGPEIQGDQQGPPSYLISLGKFLELVFRFWVIRILVRVHFPGKYEVLALDLLRRCIFGYPQYLVEIFTFYAPTC